MRTNLLLSLSVICLVIGFFYTQSTGQTPSNANPSETAISATGSWQATIIAKDFVENLGQFNDRLEEPDTAIRFGIDDGGTQTFFRPSGVTYFLVERIKNPDRKKGDMTKPKKVSKSDVVSFSWAGHNPEVTIEGVDVVPNYYQYCMPKDANGQNEVIEQVRGFKKLVYRQLYKNVDAEYVFHPNGGYKYSLQLAPGADAQKVAMIYDQNHGMRIDDHGNLIISTLYGEIIEHAPYTFYTQSRIAIPSKFVLNGNKVSFEIGTYDKNQAITIDPWVISPTIASSNCVWECDKDDAGNVYVIGGDAPMKLFKYSPAGVLQWTYNTPWDATPSAPGESDGDWLGGLATDRNGNSYITRGSLAAIQKVNTAGALQWSVAGALFSSDEYWTIAFNCDQTKLVVGGTQGVGLNIKGAIFDINASNGTVNNYVIVGTNRPSILPGVFNDAMEVRSISSSKNSRYYFLTLDSVGSINQNLNLCSSEPIFNDSHGYKLGYKSEQYRPSTGNGPNCAIRANDKFVYTHGGNIVHKRDLNSGAILASAAIPGGITTVTAGFSQPGNNGIDVDSCGNVYVGSADRIIKFDANLNIISSVNLPFRVFDVSVNHNGEVIAVGGTGTSSSTTRTGYIQSVNMGACVPFPLVCCDPTICPVNPVCDNGSNVNLVVATPGGVFSGNGIANPSVGVFNPALAGPGVHKITYTLPCGADSTFVTVNACANLVVCRETNGDFTVSGGVGPYTWQRGVPFQNCTGCPLGNCIPFICAGFADTTWTTFSTNATTPPGAFPIRVTDANGNRLKLTSATGIQPCTTCPNYTTTVTSQTNIDCVNPTGSATVSSTGGTAPYTYNWSPGNLTGPSQSGLAAGSYTVIATDANSCRDTITITITSSGTPPTVTATATPTTCGLNNGTATATGTGVPPITYQWLPIGTIAQTVSNLAPGDYIVVITDGSGCPAAGGDTVTVAASSGFTTAVTTTPSACTANNGTATATNTGGTGPFNYAWTPNVGNTATVNNLPPGSYTVTVTDASNCSATSSGTVTQSSGNLALNLTNPVNPTCAGNDGSITASLSGGTAPYTVTIDTGGTPIVINLPIAISQTISNLPDGSVTVTVVDAQGCQVINSATLTAPNCCTFGISANLTQPTCGQANGEIMITPSNGSGNYSFTWGNGVGTGNSAMNLVAGTYNVTITDNGFANCFIDTFFALNSNSSLNLSLTNPVNPTCAGNDGSITASLSGGTAPYTVTIDTGGTPIVINLPIAISQTISNLPDGSVTVTVVDAQGCQVVNSATLTAPNCCTFSVTAAITQPTCGLNNGSIVLTPANGSGNYAYSWTSSGNNTNSETNIGDGTYDVVITDNGFANCFIDTTFTLNSNNTLSLGLSNQVDPTCANNNGSFTLSINGGTAPYVVTLDTGGVNPVTLNIATAGSHVVGNLPGGNVNITVTDAQGCQITAALSLFPPANCCTFTISAALTDPTCGQNDGSITITPANGSGNYSYTWGNGVATMATANNLGAGNYTVTITDNGFTNCFVDTAFSLINPNAPTITLTSQTNVDCNGQSTGSITVQVSGGTPPVQPAWNTGDTTLTITNRPAGNYTVTVTDANNCASNASYTITEPSDIILSLLSTPIDCTDPLSGSASVVASGGSGPYTYLWSNAATVATLTNVSVGTYIVTVTDNVGCTAIDSIAVTGDSIASFVLGPDQSICFGDSVVLGTGLSGTAWSTGDTAAYLTVTEAGTYWGTIGNGSCTATDSINILVDYAPLLPELNVTDTILCESETVILMVSDEGYLYVWSTGDTAKQLVVDTPGIYTVTAINNCGEASADALVSDENCACRIHLPNAFSPNNDGANDVFKAYTQCTEVEGFVIKIFDRWGGLVYKSDDLNGVWDGTSKGSSCTPGVYVYTLSYLSRENGVRQIHRQKGSVTLLR